MSEWASFNNAWYWENKRNIFVVNRVNEICSKHWLIWQEIRLKYHYRTHRFYCVIDRRKMVTLCVRPTNDFCTEVGSSEKHPNLLLHEKCWTLVCPCTWGGAWEKHPNPWLYEECMNFCIKTLFSLSELKQKYLRRKPLVLKKTCTNQCIVRECLFDDNRN